MAETKEISLDVLIVRIMYCTCIVLNIDWQPCLDCALLKRCFHSLFSSFFVWIFSRAPSKAAQYITRFNESCQINICAWRLTCRDRLFLTQPTCILYLPVTWTEDHSRTWNAKAHIFVSSFSRSLFTIGCYAVSHNVLSGHLGFFWPCQQLEQRKLVCQHEATNIG